MAIIIVCYHCSDPGPIEAYGKLGNGSGLVNITGHGSEEVRKLPPVTQTGAARRVTHLKDKKHTCIDIIKLHSYSEIAYTLRLL